MKMTRLSGALAAAGALVLLAACAPATTESGPQSTVSISTAPSVAALPPAPEDPRPEVIWPLTGADAEGVKASTLDRPALAVKIENTEAARPQENLDKADVVFEEYVEYGISRLVAIYNSEYPKSVGPIRSMRPMDRHIMGSFGGPLIFSGAQGRFIDSARDSGQLLLAQDVGSSGFYRTSDRAAPHNLHGYLAEFAAQAEKSPAPEEQWDWAYPSSTATAQEEGKTASFIDIHMSDRAQPEWKWSKADKVWVRYEDGTKHVTSAGDNLTAKNVVMLWVDVKYTSGDAKSSVPETLLSGKSGKGYVASGDSYIPITWSKKGQYEPFVFTTEDGDAVSLIPGQTWVELVPNADTVGHSTAIKIS